MLLIAHRGFRVGVPENSLIGFRLAADMGLDAIECDIHRSKDGKLVVMHDASVDRTTNGKGRLELLSSQELSLLTLRPNAQTECESATIPFLDEAFNAISPPIRFMVELKGRGVSNPFLNLVNREHIQDRVIISGRDIPILQAVHAREPKTPLCLNITNCPQLSVRSFLRVKFPEELPVPLTMVSLRASRVNRKFIDHCHKLGSLALAWDFLSPHHPLRLAKKLALKGIDGLLLDDPKMVDPLRSAM